MKHKGIWAALAAAILFGASTPAAKALLGGLDPWLLAGLLYLGSGLGLGLLRLVLPGGRARMAPADWPWLLGAIAAGGIAGPVLLMQGLAGTSAAAASLLLNAESVFTALLAWLVFREHAEARIVVGMVAIVVGALVLSWPQPGQAVAASWPSLAILWACLCWAVDNNLTRKVSLADPMQVAAVKGLVAGGCNVALALAIGADWPRPDLAVAAGALGLVGYGLSLVAFVVGLRELGAARTGAYFATAPFVGALLSVALLGDGLDWRLAAAAVLMGLGVWLHLTERHEHDHHHHEIEHEHAHDHDEHHRHDHDGVLAPDGGADGAHVHWHRHQALRHRHPHYPDAHHRHEHG